MLFPVEKMLLLCYNYGTFNGCEYKEENMKLGISSPLAHTSPEEWAAKQKQEGCECVVFPLSCEDKEADIAAYEQAAKIKGLQVAEVGIWRNALAADEKERNAAMDYSIGQLKLADRLHARCCVNVAGAAGPVWDGAYKENFSQDMWDRTVRMIQEILDEAKPKHTYFTLESMPWMIPGSPEEYLRLLEAVNRDRFAVHLDIINMITTPERYFFPERFLEQTFSLLGPHIRSCHVKDILLLPAYTFQLRECACGEGTFPLEYYAELADRADPEMPMIIEHLDTDEAYLQSLGYVRRRLAKTRTI